MSASRISALPISTQQEGGAGQPVTHGLDRRGHDPIVRYSRVLTISSLKENDDQRRLLLRSPHETQPRS